ncbi:hypothetical protein PV783_01745 [Chitinophaga sp. CC14]|uniref:hypothetical protein n=1 Tax=Chitinophaga sp. CC14 TaxID=3029199 RepID=UPI003B795B49
MSQHLVRAPVAAIYQGVDTSLLNYVAGAGSTRKETRGFTTTASNSISPGQIYRLLF